MLAQKASPKAIDAGLKATAGTRKADADADFWKALEAAREPEFYRQYLKIFPEGRYAALARSKLNSFRDTPQIPLVSGEPYVTAPVVPDLGNLTNVNTIKAELAYWNSVKDAKRAKPFGDYLAKYPNGMFAEVARLKIAALEGAESK